MFKDCAEANAVLSDPEKRAMFDRGVDVDGSAPDNDDEHLGHGHGGFGRGGGHPFGRGGGGGAQGIPPELFEMFMGGGFGGGGGGFGGMPPGMGARGGGRPRGR
jgi:DnaJ-class molecular chaperone